MLRADAQRMLKVDIEYVQPLFEGARNFALGVVEIALDLHTVASRELPGPAGQQVSARDPDIAGGRLIDRAAVGVALQREGAGRRSPIRPEPRLAAVPAVLDRSAVGPRGMVAVGDLAVDPKRAVRAQLSALPRSRAALEIPGSRHEQSALRLPGGPGRLVAPERRISSPVMTKTEAGASDRRSARRDTEVISRLASSSRLRSARSEGLPV